MFGLSPFEEIFIWGLIVSLLMAVLYRVFVKPHEIAAIKKDLEFYRKKINAANKVGDTKKAQELLGEMMKVNHRMLSKNMKPMMFSMLIAIAVLGVIGQEYPSAVIHLPFALPFAGIQLNWLWWYIIVTFPFSLLFRKFLGVD